jgi:hypothetical protein
VRRYAGAPVGLCGNEEVSGALHDRSRCADACGGSDLLHRLTGSLAHRLTI